MALSLEPSRESSKLIADSRIRNFYPTTEWGYGIQGNRRYQSAERNCGCAVVGVYENGDLGAAARLIDAQIGGIIGRLIAGGDFAANWATRCCCRTRRAPPPSACC